MSAHYRGHAAAQPKVVHRLKPLDPSALAKAEAALKQLSTHFGQWLQDEVAHLEAARQRVHQQGFTVETGRDLYRRAHDLKGLGATYGFPIISHIAGSICTMIDRPSGSLGALMTKIDLSVAAITHAMTADIRTASESSGHALLLSLERADTRPDGLMRSH